MPELTYNTGASALQMAQTIFGDGVTVTGASYTGDPDASAIYTDGDTISPGVVPSDTGVILEQKILQKIVDFRRSHEYEVKHHYDG